MLKTFEVHSKWRNIDRHSKCILTALWLHSEYSYGISTAFETFWSHSRENGNGKPFQILPECPECASNEPEHLECISIAAGIYFDFNIISAGMHIECRWNLSIAARMQLECSRNVPIGPRMSPDVIQNTAESHIQEYTDNFHSDCIPAHSASSVTRVWNSLPNVARFFYIFFYSPFRLVLLDSCWFRISVTGPLRAQRLQVQVCTLRGAQIYGCKLAP